MLWGVRIAWWQIAANSVLVATPLCPHHTTMDSTPSDRRCSRLVCAFVARARRRPQRGKTACPTMKCYGCPLGHSGRWTAHGTCLGHLPARVTPFMFAGLRHMWIRTQLQLDIASLVNFRACPLPPTRRSDHNLHVRPRGHRVAWVRTVRSGLLRAEKRSKRSVIDSVCRVGLRRRAFRFRLPVGRQHLCHVPARLPRWRCCSRRRTSRCRRTRRAAASRCLRWRSTTSRTTAGSPSTTSSTT